jgi:hypothetical protein
MQQIQKFMPLIFVVIYIEFPAGVGLYFIVSSMFRIAQQEWMYKRDPHITAAVAKLREMKLKNPPPVTSAPKNWRERLAALAPSVEPSLEPSEEAARNSNRPVRKPPNQGKRPASSKPGSGQANRNGMNRRPGQPNRPGQQSKPAQQGKAGQTGRAGQTGKPSGPSVDRPKGSSNGASRPAGTQQPSDGKSLPSRPSDSAAVSPNGGGAKKRIGPKVPNGGATSDGATPSGSNPAGTRRRGRPL